MPRHLKVCRLLKGIGIIMIRFIFVVLFVVLFLILSTPLMLVEWIIGKFNPGLKSAVWIYPQLVFVYLC